jgi:predicted small secreted protein
MRMMPSGRWQQMRGAAKAQVTKRQQVGAVPTEVALHLLYSLANNQGKLKTTMMTFIKRIAFLLFVTAFSAIVGVGCNTARGFGKDVQNAGEGIQNSGRRIDGERTAEHGYNHIADQRIEDSRTAERVREALAASADYKYEGITVTACDGVVQLSGFVNTSAQRNSAVEAAIKVLGAKSVESKVTVKD